MAWFRCTLGGGGGSLELEVTCDSDFAGLVIYCTDGVTTLTQTCPSSSPYVVNFSLPNEGTWTVSGTVGGVVQSVTVTISGTVDLHVIPVGATATPVNNIQTWLHCAEIWDKSYTTIGEVLSDNSVLLALISSNNASDYLARSTSWASNITANSVAMSYIGNNNYCANQLLANSTWCNSICNSTYFESVLNVKVPAMTGATTPSGTVSANGYYSPYYPFYAFDDNASTGWATAGTPTNNDFIQYDFAKSVKIYKIYTKVGSLTGGQLLIKKSTDGSTFNTIQTFNYASGNVYTGIVTGATAARYYRLQPNNISTQSGYSLSVATLQFYGRNA